MASLDRYFPLESKVPRYFEVFATPGVYEVRLLLDLYYKSPENSKKLDVALRYNCVDATFEVDTLSLESERR